MRRLAAIELDASCLDVRGRFAGRRVDAAGGRISVDWTTDRAKAPWE